MKKMAIILALMLVLGVVFISGCATNNTGNNSGQNGNTGSSGQKNSSGIPGYSTAQIISIGPENIVSEPVKTNK